jgi:uncharacterized membrane protein HdeD (DUF308 family)
MSDTPPETSTAVVAEIVTEVTPEDVKQTAKQFKGVLIAFGILNIIFGFIAMGAPLMTGTVITVIIGIMLIMNGIFELIHAFNGAGWKAGAFDFVFGILSVIGGGLILAQPMIGLAMLTTILIAYFILDGITRIIVALKIKPEQGWGILLTAGLASLILGIMIWRHWPLSGLWAIGVLVGIKIMFAGWSMLFLGTAVGTVLKEDTK